MQQQVHLYKITLVDSSNASKLRVLIQDGQVELRNKAIEKIEVQKIPVY